MQRDTRYRLITLLVGIGILAVVFLFLALVRIAADAHVDLADLPTPVLETLCEHAGENAALVQVVRGTTPDTRTYRIVLERPDGSSQRLWLAADGTPWPPQDGTSATD